MVCSTGFVESFLETAVLGEKTQNIVVYY